MDHHERHHEIGHQFDHETGQYLPETGGRHALTIVLIGFIVLVVPIVLVAL
ncbi:hypothetical protein [Streptomyces sp. B21-083]|uniref:hypothetical protein n=1 Tax=Streptomyces sp. B21-083 TaxID=3039410 RepID=UPI002FF37408